MQNVQERLLTFLEKRLNSSISLSKWLANILDIDYSVAYRKVHNSSSISLNQLSHIVKEDPVVLNEVVSAMLPDNYVLSKFHHFQSFGDAEIYFRNILSTFSKAQKKDGKLSYVARDFPLFFFIANPLVLDYKLSMWTNQIISKGIIRFPKEIHRLANEVFEAYTSLPSEEIWYKGLAYNNVAQLKWHSDIQVVSPQEQLELQKALLSTLDIFESWSKIGEKTAAPYNLIVTDYCTMNNGGVLQMENREVLMIALNSIFFASSEHERLVESFHTEFEAQKACGQTISKTNILARNKFFRNQRKCIHNLSRERAGDEEEDITTE